VGLAKKTGIVNPELKMTRLEPSEILVSETLVRSY
jgi:hypothetical protein